MVSLKSEGVEVGVPLGGIGAGKVEISNKGKMINLTVANNWSSPIKEMMGYHVFILPDDSEPFFLQSELIFLDLNKLAIPLEYEGLYPFAFIKGSKNNVKAELEAFSALIPGDLTDSALPAIGVSVRVSGSKSGLIALSVSNITGISKIGRYNEALKNGIRMRNSKANDLDPYNGETVLISPSPKIIVKQYNFHVNRGLEKTLNLHRLIENEAPWRELIERKVPDSDEGESSGTYYWPAGMLVSEYSENTETRFVFAWYFNKPWVYYPYKHYYSNYFSSAKEVADFFLDNFDRLRDGTRRWQEDLIDPSLPHWLRDAVINSTYILSSSTWLDEKGRFGILEGTQVGPMLSTIGGVCYETGSLPVVIMFPELERSTIKQFIANMRDDGYIPHDLGTYSLDMPSDGTTAPPKWKDTNTTFVLLVYRYYLRTGDLDFLRTVYPYLRKAMEWIISKDRDGDGLPEDEGSTDQGFDCVPIEGVCSYISSVYIASLEAMVKVSEILGDKESLSYYSGKLEKARESFLKLYDGKKFVPWTGKPDHHNAVFSPQVFGEWWAHLLGLEDIVDREKVSSALDEIYRVNGHASKYCTPNIAKEGEKLDDLDSQLTSSWPRLVFSNSALGLWLGKEEWLEIAKKEWDNLVSKGLMWNQPSLIHGHDGEPDRPFLDHYIGSAAPWSFTYKYALKKVLEKSKK
ncbi:GH116 family glycosyl hydrolase [Stygiolobus caldivivus]|uniref:Glycosyl-hydrolase family 116 catalytic region domain-containing protein n=1 Tax=Stygiolobus caldivivus TaxID=2824673 RepID=A0A8D5U6L6_9CREN|nr:GH116 family glycosyl hydrolase [Stygiolobus caldivivus]BCU70025.1 hypothetical protein KN1_13220 [Stygiolobus caldivivus]